MIIAIFTANIQKKILPETIQLKSYIIRLRSYLCNEFLADAFDVEKNKKLAGKSKKEIVYRQDKQLELRGLHSRSYPLL